MYGSVPTLYELLEKSNFDGDKFLPASAMRAADQILRWGSVARLKILFLDDQAGQQLQNYEFFQLIIKKWDEGRLFTNPWHKERQNWDIVFDLVDNVSEKMTEEHWGNELLCLAAGVGCMPIVQREGELRNELLRANQLEEKQSSFGKSTHQSIGQAVLGNHVDIVEYLLRQDGIEAHLRYRNYRGENVLHLASGLCNPEIFRILIPRFQEGINREDVQGDVPLLRIIMSPLASRYESANVFLSQSSLNRSSLSLGWQRDSLRAAMSRLDLDLCCILIWIGNINPVATLTYGNESQINTKEGGPRNDGSLLGNLVDLLISESEGNSAQLTGSVEEALVLVLLSLPLCQWS
ncbi:ankyrin repeat-containing domain protein [Penicillium hordei]|uniref:Ankyrin repeat-containing domain protein n=1 Tax=Penicillium hordei TaxID=40994 RepID=A0AAD6EDK1_9EURO|nr:ankyrin repeat-containing domain protein [Penicillium hordei]KAJ5615036.1 ankyrin repeat-containing domain protein [Penicillium hordei]